MELKTKTVMEGRLESSYDIIRTVKKKKKSKKKVKKNIFKQLKKLLEMK